MQSGTNQADVAATDARARRDRGASFIELLVAVVLLGLVVVGVLTAVRTTVIATRIERDHAKAGQWLESAAKAIETTDFGNCVDNNIDSTQALSDYNEAVINGAEVPDGWDKDAIEVTADPGIEVWTGSNWLAYDDQLTCADNDRYTLQRVTVQVRSPDGDIIEQLQVVKRGG